MFGFRDGGAAPSCALSGSGFLAWSTVHGDFRLGDPQRVGSEGFQRAPRSDGKVSGIVQPLLYGFGKGPGAAPHPALSAASTASDATKGLERNPRAGTVWDRRVGRATSPIDMILGHGAHHLRPSRFLSLRSCFGFSALGVCADARILPDSMDWSVNLFLPGYVP